MNDEDRPDGAEARLLRRMQAADPAQTFQMADSWTSDQVEATMSTTRVEPKSRPRRWAPAMAAAATLAVIGGGAYTILGGNDPASTPDPTAITLSVPTGTGTSISSCIPFDVQYLRDMPVAFSGSATEVGEDSITLEVDRWYTGGDADVVQLTNYDRSTVSLDGFAFEQGDRYLVTATDGTVNFCGYSGPWNQERADAFDEAFGS